MIGLLFPPKYRSSLKASGVLASQVTLHWMTYSSMKEPAHHQVSLQLLVLAVKSKLFFVSNKTNKVGLKYSKINVTCVVSHA